MRFDEPCQVAHEIGIEQHQLEPALSLARLRLRLATRSRCASVVGHVGPRCRRGVRVSAACVAATGVEERSAGRGPWVRPCSMRGVTSGTVWPARCERQSADSRETRRHATAVHYMRVVIAKPAVEPAGADQHQPATSGHRRSPMARHGLASASTTAPERRPPRARPRGRHPGFSGPSSETAPHTRNFAPAVPRGIIGA